MNTEDIPVVQSPAHPNKIVNNLREAIVAYDHLYMWHSHATAVAMFLHVCLGIHDLHDLRYVTNADMKTALAKVKYIVCVSCVLYLHTFAFFFCSLLAGKCSSRPSNS